MFTSSQNGEFEDVDELKEWLELKSDDLYITQYGWRKPWRIKKNQSTKLFNENIKQLIIKDTWKFLSKYTYS